MALSSVGLSNLNSSLIPTTYDRPVKINDSKGQLFSTAPSSTVNASLATEYYKSTNYAIDLTTSDGDRLSLSYQSIEYQKTMMTVSGDINDPKVQDIIKFMKDQYQAMRKDLLDSFVKAIGGKVDETDETEKTEKTQKLDIPEYWNAENTSQRIVDFAVSFYGSFQGKGEDYLKTIKAAIEEGFKQAKEILGDLPDAVSGLMQDTYDLVMKKLEEWAKAQGIDIENKEEEVVDEIPENQETEEPSSIAERV